MESYIAPGPLDLVTPDGKITKILKRDSSSVDVYIDIADISPVFAGYLIPSEFLYFNIKSTLAQLGINGEGIEYELRKKELSARVLVRLTSIGIIAKNLLSSLGEGCYIGKLFAADPKRRVRNPDYLLRMFGRCDRDGFPLLSLSGEKEDLVLEKIDGRTVAHLVLKEGVIQYDETIGGFLPTLAEALKRPHIKTRELLKLHQAWKDKEKRIVHKDEILLIQTAPLHIRTAFGRVVAELLPKGVKHTSADVLQPDTRASGDIYELYGNSDQEITHIPLEFYTLEPHREHVFFSDRDQLQASLESQDTIFKTFETAPKNSSLPSAVFVVKGEQLLNLTEKDWITRNPNPGQSAERIDPIHQAEKVQSYIESDPSYPFLKSIENGLITSQGVLFSRYFPSPLMKKMLLGDLVQYSLKGIYFQYPSQAHGEYFSHEDRSMLLDLAKFAIPVFWADKTCGKILQFAPKPEKDTGMFVPIPQVKEFTDSTVFGVYGSTLMHLQFEEELSKILAGVLELRKEIDHPLLNSKKPISLITGGGPGLMEVGNRVAKNLGILSCANIVDFSGVEQEQNPYIEAKMTYRLDKLVERQGEFNLDFPIFLMGGFGTDFEFALEGVRRKVGIGVATPVLLIGKPEYWRGKITSNFQTNLKAGTLKDAEWVSNCFYAVETAKAALSVYEKYFSGTLPIGKQSPIAPEGFYTISE